MRLPPTSSPSLPRRPRWPPPATTSDASQVLPRPARQLWTWLPEGAVVFTASSVTADGIGLTKAIDESGRYTATRPQLIAMDPATQMSEMRRLSAAPEWVIGTVHALTVDGDLVIASASGSQLASMAYGAQHVLFIIGAQKIVPDMDTAMRRIREYSLPLEDARAHAAYGIGSSIHKVLLIHGDFEENRIHVLLVDEPLGY